jgi:alpha/beta superfamily hydrolase
MPAEPAPRDVAVPDGAEVGAVLLHPHPDYGGDRYNVVVEALWRALPPAGVAAVRFDFPSSDLAACVDRAAEALALLPASMPVFVVGYSFGGVVGASVLDERVAGWVLVAAPLGGDASPPVAGDERRKLVLVPAHDQFCPPDRARALVAGWRCTELEVVAGADHFLAGATGRVADRVRDWILATPPAGR